MGFKSLVQNLASSAIKTVGDIAVTITYQNHGALVYDAMSDTNVVTMIEKIVQGVEVQPRTSEKDTTPVVKNQKRILIAAKDLGGVPTDRDTMLFSGLRWEVIRIDTDPAAALWIFTVRLP
jgi:hypothetical protein